MRKNKVLLFLTCSAKILQVEIYGRKCFLFIAYGMGPHNSLHKIQNSIHKHLTSNTTVYLHKDQEFSPLFYSAVAGLELLRCLGFGQD